MTVSLTLDERATRIEPVNVTALRAPIAAPGRFDILVRNALNTTYRDFLSRFKGFANGPGINVVFKVSAGTW